MAERSALIFGARNLGRAIIETLTEAGWRVAGVARSDKTLEGVTAAGALAIRADVTDLESVRAAAEQAAEAHGSLDLVVNAAAAYGGPRSGPFGGGPLAEAAPDAFDAWAAAPPRAAFAFLSGTSRFLVAQGRPATIVQVTGGSSRRAMPGRGLWAAGAFGVRAVTQAAALELREHGIQVTLLIVDAGIEPLTGTRPGADPAALADPHEIAAAVRFLGEQGSRAATHELQVTPLGERWVPQGDPGRLTDAERALIVDPGVERCLSPISVWEAAIKRQAGRLRAPAGLSAILAAEFRMLDVTAPLLEAAADLPPHHADPFDRVLVAHALERELAVLTRNAAFGAYGVRLATG